MAAPFVYVPEASSPPVTHNPYYSTPQGGPSPFLPPSALLSPYLGGSSGPCSASGSPNFNANSVLWPENAPPYESSYTASWAPLSNRQRTTSWHGPAPTPNSPFLQPSAPPFLHTQSAYSPPGHRRSVSWGAANAPPPPSWLNSANPYLTHAPQTPLQIHPWLNGDAPSPIFHFDLMPTQFAPLRLVHPNPPQTVVLGPAEIHEPAFHPPLTALRILHPRIPFWPIDLALPAELAAEAATPISLGDVLVALHRSLHERISQADWATLGNEDELAVTKAFTIRCRAEAVRSGVPPAHLRDKEVAERNQGVKRVDFLLGKTVFKGLVRAPGDPEGCVRVVTA
ncbi:hypothetical protein DFH07DRAFT_911422 [Mycena maculata]|uniref:DUF6699 domain-containing protein n=1 Tax=Mycena maculata TaxID=230809 RepID=A0AAD7K6U7_9AGAR|nr:hypothetical protein DFH07DRAFT_911422 [Mycena maculata]